MIGSDVPFEVNSLSVVTTASAGLDFRTGTGKVPSRPLGEIAVVDSPGPPVYSTARSRSFSGVQYVPHSAHTSWPNRPVILPLPSTQTAPLGPSDPGTVDHVERSGYQVDLVAHRHTEAHVGSGYPQVIYPSSEMVWYDIH